MATSDATLSLMDKIAMVGIWIEAVLYGVNCAMYGLCMFTLLRGGNTARLRWMLVVMSTILFLLCTVHAGTSLRQLLEAFVYAPTDVPNYSGTYWFDYTAIPYMLSGNVYATVIIGQDIILIWRLYVVFMCDWRVTVIPAVLAAGCVGCVYAASNLYVLPNNGLFGSLTTSLIISAWVFGFTLNASVTGAIVTRLWRMGRTMASLEATPTNRFGSSIYVIIESGAISAATNVVVLALFASSNPVSLVAINVASQLVVLTPLLIVVQVGQTSRYRIIKGDLTKTSPTTQGEIVFQERAPLDSGQDIPLQTTRSRRPSCVHGVHAPVR